VARRVLAAAALAGALAAGPLLSGCSQPRPGPAARPPGAAPHATVPAAGPRARASAHAGTPATAGRDPGTRAALLRIAQAFNNAYDNGGFGAVYDRWDARSQALISRAEYIRRHRVCAPATHVTAVVTGASPAAAGGWHVRYQIGGQELTDTWFYVRHRWVFDIVLSNPGAARLYRLPFARYAAAAGCPVH